MNKSKIYFTSSIIVNTLLLVSELFLFFDPFDLLNHPLAGGSNYNRVVLVVFFAPVILLPLITILLLWGLWLVLKSKVRNRFVMIGMSVSLLLLVATVVLILVLLIIPIECPLGLETPSGVCLNLE